MRFLSLLLFTFSIPLASAAEYDIIVYGGTSGGVTAAIQAARMGKTVVLIEPTQHIGGLTSGGLGMTDSGNKAVIGGLSREFYRRLKKHYDQPTAWTHEQPSDYKLYRKDDDAMWTFEPKIAEKTLREMLTDAKVPIVERERLERSAKGIKLNGKSIVSITMESGKSFTGKMFIDATYEGDLMALAGVTYHVGRESNTTYGESLNGVARKWNLHNHRFTVKVDPFVKPGDASSGLLFGIEKELPPEGAADHRLQAFCFRMCMTNKDGNRIPFEKPQGYDESKYELLFRNFEAGDKRLGMLPLHPAMMPNRKTDTNNNGAVSTDFIGRNYQFADGTYAERERIIQEHEVYQKGLMWALANHPRVPQATRDIMAKWGLAKDEFVETGGWPHQIYVREARRLIGQYVHTELDCRRARPTPGSVGMGSYNMDSHNCARYVTPEGFVQNEGDVQQSPGGAYPIAYGSIIPNDGECPNLFVPVCVSSSHIAYGSIRMEPVFMVLGQSAATAAVFAIDDSVPVQKVSYDKLKARLLADKQVLEFADGRGPRTIDRRTLKGVVVDDEEAEKKGFESVSTSLTPFVGAAYRHDGNTKRGEQSATYAPDLPQAGRYEVRMNYTPSDNRSTKVKVTIRSSDGEHVVYVNQKTRPSADGFLSLGTYTFAAGKGGKITISNEGSDGYVVIDAMQWVETK
jgi:FAD dependent oxidoreductase